MKSLSYKKVFIIAAIFLFLSGGNIAKAANVGDIANFNVDKGFDANGRTKISAVLIKVSTKLYFYVEKSWWDLKTLAEQNQIVSGLDNLSSEFDNNIYPNLTSKFGSEWVPGIDNDSRVSILFESMNSTEGGYFREDDEYEKLQLPDSNQREMVYLSVSHINDADAKVILAHEFTHLITFNQKNKTFGVEEDVWLNEARADYSSTMLGYDNNYNGSNLQQRVKDFIENTSDSITDWTGTRYDYASVGLFTHYLVEHYGINILSNSLKSKLVGIKSINEALLGSGTKDNFAQIFTNWTLALMISDCSQNSAYCYSDENLKGLKVNPTLIFLPLTGDSSLSSTNVTKNWAGNWQKIVGGSGNLKLDFSSLAGLSFQMPYITYDKSNNYSVNFLQLNDSGKGEINIKDFGTKYKFLIVIPSLQTKISGFDGLDLIYPYTITVSIVGQNSSDADQIIIQKLLAQIDDLKKQIANILSQKQGGQTTKNSNYCSQLNKNLFLGMTGSQVICLQGFLKNQGLDIYPEGYVTGSFGNLTKAAVIRFQEKHAIPGTGYVGQLTRAKINQILNEK